MPPGFSMAQLALILQYRSSLDNVIRRLVVRHTAGPYPGLRQIIGLVKDAGVEYFHTGQFRPWGGAGNGDVLNQVQLWPEGRLANLMRLRGDDRYVLYQERPATI